jgi:zinc protease
MKKLFFYISIALWLPFTAMGQIDRSKIPAPAPAKEIQLGNYESFILPNGLKVFVVTNNKLPRVAFNLVLDLDPVLEGDKAGYVSMAGQMLRRGTVSKSKAVLDEEIDFIGANISTSSNGIFASALSRHNEKLLQLMTDILFNPAFSEEEFEKLKKQTLSNLANESDNPDAIAGKVFNALVYGKNHPYGEATTESTVKNITLADCRAYYASYFKPNVAYLAIVGDISKKEAEKLVKKYFSKWKKADVPKFQFEVPQAPEKTFVALVDRSVSVQSNIRIGHPIVLKPGDPEVVKASVLNQILGGGFSGRLFQNLRETHAYTYGAYSSIGNNRLVSSFSTSASVRNEVTDSAVYEFFNELHRIRNEKVSEEELRNAISFLTGSFARSLENPQTVATFAINTARYSLPKDYYSNYLKNLQAVTVEDVQAMAQKYILTDNAYIMVVGKGEEVAENLSKFGEVKYFSKTGEAMKVPSPNDVPAGMNAEKVLEAYFKALGGKENLEKVASIKTVMKAEAMGRELMMTLAKKDGKLYQDMQMGGMVLQKTVYDGEKAAISAQGRNIPVEADQIGELAMQAYIFPELEYLKDGVDLELKGIESIEGVPSYILKYTFPSGRTQTAYFAKESGLKIREVSSQDSPMGKVNVVQDYDDYKAVNGIMIPHIMVINQGFRIEAKLTQVEINKITDDTLFQLN